MSSLSIPNHFPATILATFALSLALISAVASAQGHMHSEQGGSMHGDHTSHDDAAMHGSMHATSQPTSPEASAAVNARCPVMGLPVNPAITVEHEGQTVAFCCPSCPRAFQANPDHFMASLRQSAETEPGSAVAPQHGEPQSDAHHSADGHSH